MTIVTQIAGDGMTRNKRTTSGGLGAVLSARIRAATKEALEREAEATKRTVSQIADQWLEFAGSTPSDLRDLAVWMSAVRKRIVDRLGNPETSPQANLTLRKAWIGLVEDLVGDLPTATDRPEDRDVAEANKELWDASNRLLAEVDRVIFEHINGGGSAETLEAGVKLLMAPTVQLGLEDDAEMISPLRLLREQPQSWEAIDDVLREVGRESPNFDPFITAIYSATRKLERAELAASQADLRLHLESDALGREIVGELKP